MRYAFSLCLLVLGCDVDVDIDPNTPTLPTGTGTGTGTGTPPVTPYQTTQTVSDVVDTFAHDPGAVDLLFVVDDSGSMADEHDVLAGSFQAAIDALDDDALDYHIGLVTTDMEDPAKQGRLQSDDSGARFIDLTDPDPNTSFAQMADPTQSASPFEQGLDAAAAALVDHRNGYNIGFRRNEAQLAVVVLSDEEDGSVDGPKDIANIVTGDAPGAGDASFSSIVVTVGDCMPLVPGLRYLETTALVGGVEGTICDSDYSATLAQVVDELWSSVPYALSATPDETTIVVTEHTPTGVFENVAWTYDASDDTIRLLSSDAAPGADITVAYTPL